MAAMVERLDGSIGQLLEKLDALGIADRTIVVFFSDNGGLASLQDQKPLRGGKATLFEGGIRVPLAIRWPGVVTPGRQSSVPVISNDFFPTFLEVAGIPLDGRETDGVSLVPLLKETGALERDALYWHYPHYHHQDTSLSPSGAIRQGDDKLIEWFEEAAQGDDLPVSLFDLKDDLGEEHDLAEERPEKAKELLAKLRAWQEAVGAQRMEPNPDYDPERADQNP
jgi:arylsulfatase A-like enzyme